MPAIRTKSGIFIKVEPGTWFDYLQSIFGTVLRLRFQRQE